MMNLFGGSYAGSKSVQGLLAIGVALMFNVFVNNALGVVAPQIASRDLFVALIIIGMLAVIGGVYLKYGKAIQWGLALGGIIMVFIAAMQSFSSAPDTVTVLTLAVAFAVMLWLGANAVKE